MTIVGIGLDATDLPRIAAAIERYGDRFLSRILTDEELAYCRRRKDPVPHVAGRFAAKEAAARDPLETQRAQGVLWRDIEVFRRGGPPQLRFHGAAGRHFARLGAKRALLTITHAQTVAIAHLILVDD